MTSVTILADYRGLDSQLPAVERAIMDLYSAPEALKSAVLRNRGMPLFTAIAKIVNEETLDDLCELITVGHEVLEIIIRRGFKRLFDFYAHGDVSVGFLLDPAMAKITRVSADSCWVELRTVECEFSIPVTFLARNGLVPLQGTRSDPFTPWVGEDASSFQEWREAIWRLAPDYFLAYPVHLIIWNCKPDQTSKLRHLLWLDGLNHPVAIAVLRTQLRSFQVADSLDLVLALDLCWKHGVEAMENWPITGYTPMRYKLSKILTSVAARKNTLRAIAAAQYRGLLRTSGVLHAWTSFDSEMIESLLGRMC